MNKALLAKLGWRLLNDHTSLWARVLRSKYKVEDINDASWTIAKCNWSSTWRSVGAGMREVVIPGLSWVLGDGSKIRFWKDKWLLNRPLSELAVTEIPEEIADASVRDLWRNGIGWLLPNVAPYVSTYTRLQLAAVVLDDVTGEKDRLSWGQTQDGSFTVKSAYAFITRDHSPRQNMQSMFGRVWQVVAPERVKVFLWLVVNQVIMTNMERQRRHLSDTSVCQVCKGGEESILHVLRDCPAMYGVWTRIIPLQKRRVFFERSLLEWAYENLGETLEVEGSPWSTTFAMAIWWGWKWRCSNVFGVNGKCRDRVRFLKELAKEVWFAHSKVKGARTDIIRVERLISWISPTDGWVKLNTDGASHGNPGLATAGGVLRDENGTWCGGFAFNIGICSAPLAELWGVYYGLFIAWERRVARLQLEVDSEIVVGFLKTGISDSHPLSFLVRLCYGFLSRDWIVQISHVYREANRLADGLANYAFSLPLGLHLFDLVPDSVQSIMSDDVNGAVRPRLVRE